MSMPKGYVSSDYLQLLEDEMMDFKRKSYAGMNIHPGDSVLDVGCGPGSDTLRLAELVGVAGEVIGIDYDEEMVARANQRALDSGLGARVKHEQSNAESLSFPDAYFDSSRSERLFQHLQCPERALFEMARVTKPNGWVVVLDTDWGTLSMHSSLPEVERRIIQHSNENCLHNAYSGRRLPQLFQRQGLEHVSVEVMPYQITDYVLAREVIVLARREADVLSAGIITQDELIRWQEDLTELDERKSFFASFNLMLAVGRK